MGAGTVASGGDGRARAGSRQQEERQTSVTPGLAVGPAAQGTGAGPGKSRHTVRCPQDPGARGGGVQVGVRGPPGVLRAGVGGSEKRLEGWPGPDLRTRHPWRTDFMWAVLGAIRQETGPEWGGGRGREMRAGGTSGRRAERTEGRREAGGQGVRGGGAGRPPWLSLDSEESAGSCILSDRSERRGGLRRGGLQAVGLPQGCPFSCWTTQGHREGGLNRGVTSWRGAALWPV